MAFTVTVTPGTTITPSTEIDAAKLNQLGNPALSVTGAFSALSNWNTVSAVSKTFTVLSATDDTLTATGHGITAATGVSDAQRVYLTTSGTLPGGLTASTTFSYYARVVDANTLTLHSTPEGVLDNTDRVDITGSGTGTHTLSYRVQVWGRPVVFNATTSKYEEGIVHPNSLPEMVGATASAFGARGAVPQPVAGDDSKVLFGDGTWGDPPESAANTLFLHATLF